MEKQRHSLIDTLIEIATLLPILLIPFAVNPWGSGYALPKAVLFRATVLILLSLHLISFIRYPRRLQLKKWLRDPLILVALATTLLVGLLTLTSRSPLVSWWGTYQRHQGFYLLLCLTVWALHLAHHLNTQARRQRSLTAVVIVGSLVALTPFIEALAWGKNPFTWRPGGSLGNPIFLGAYLIMTFPFTLTWTIRHWRSDRHRIIGLGALLLQALGLLVTQSRGPWLGGLVGLAVFAALLLWPRHRKLLGIALLIPLFLIGLLLVNARFGLVPGERLSHLPYARRLVDATDLSGGTVRVRLVLYRAAVELLTAWPEFGPHPDPLDALRPLLGYGPDTGTYAYTFVYPPELAHIEDASAIWDRSHNETLDLITMRGWLGLAAVIALCAFTVRRGLKRWAKASTTRDRAWIAAPLSALVAHAVEVQFAFSVTATSMMAWLCIAMIASRPKRREESNVVVSAPPSLRWRIYAAVGALLLLAVAVRVEGGALWADTLVARARNLDQAGQWERSIELYDRALRLTPWQAAYHRFRGEAFYNLARALPDGEVDLRDELLQAADRSLQSARRLAPLDVEGYSNAGILHAYWSETVDRAHLQQAIDFYQQAFTLAPTRVQLRLDLGRVFHQHGMMQEALEQYNTALEIDPLSTAAHYGIGVAHLTMEQEEEAEEAFRAALAIDPDCERCAEQLEKLLEE